MTAVTQLLGDSGYRAELVTQPDGSELWFINGVEAREMEPGDLMGAERFKALTGEYRRLEREKLGDIYDQCRVLLMIRAERLFIAAGYRNFRQCAEAEFDIDGRYAEQLSECARDYPREQFVAYGVALAILGLQYLRATPEDDSTADLPTKLLKHGSGAGKRFPEATTRQMKEELRGLREESAPQLPHNVPPDLVASCTMLADGVAGARFMLKNFTSRDAVTTGLVIEFEKASRAELIARLTEMVAVLSKAV